MAEFIGNAANWLINTLVAIGDWILFGNAWLHLLIAGAIIAVVTIIIAIKKNH